MVDDVSWLSGGGVRRVSWLSEAAVECTDVVVLRALLLLTEVLSKLCCWRGWAMGSVRRRRAFSC